MGVSPGQEVEAELEVQAVLPQTVKEEQTEDVQPAKGRPKRRRAASSTAEEVKQEDGEDIAEKKDLKDGMEAPKGRCKKGRATKSTAVKAEDLDAAGFPSIPQKRQKVAGRLRKLQVEASEAVEEPEAQPKSSKQPRFRRSRPIKSENADDSVQQNIKRKAAAAPRRRKRADAGLPFTF